jgi:hypothetical protein
MKYKTMNNHTLEWFLNVNTDLNLVFVLQQVQIRGFQTQIDARRAFWSKKYSGPQYDFKTLFKVQFKEL